MASFDSLNRPRLAIIAAVTVVAAAGAGYLIYSQHHETETPSSGLHRSNAVRRSRRWRRQASPSPSSTSSSNTPGDENVDVTAAQPVEGTAGDDWYNNDQPAYATMARTGHNIVHLLFRVSEDNARRNASVHRGCRCNGCGTGPIRGLRYHCANCPDFDLCENCEMQGLHYKTHVFYKIRIPAKTAGTKEMQPVWYTGDPDTTRRNLPRQLIARLSRSTGFDRPELEAAWEQWTYMANTELRDDPDELGLGMDKKTFERCLVTPRGKSHVAPNLIHDRMFAFYDANKDGIISFSEYLHGISFPHSKAKLSKIFDLYDIDEDGYISRRDFLRLFRSNYVLSMQLMHDVVDTMNDKRLGSTEAHQLVHSRQPLSSLFGRDERLPDAEFPPLEGKVPFGSPGDYNNWRPTAPVTSVVRENGSDTATREQILTRMYSPPMSPFDYDVTLAMNQTYLEALIDPPTRVEELPDLLSGRRRSSNANGGEDEAEAEAEASEDDTSVSDDAAPPPVVAGTRTHASPAGVREDAAQNADGDDRRAVRQRGVVDPEYRYWTSAEPEEERRRAVRKQMHDRWKRRQFYLDEEEGVSPPDGWEAEDDVLVNVDVNANANVNGESSKAAQAAALSPRSRSSSKVRFAEDEDFDGRSMHSASSRSVPERWGGVEIPDAERDAGKEILYQVTQQAYNELLDTLFKKKEDMALDAAETKEIRDMFRTRFAHIELDPDAGLTCECQERFSDGEYTSEEGGDDDDDDGDYDDGRADGPGDADTERRTETGDGEDGRGRRDPTMPQFRPNSHRDVEATRPSPRPARSRPPPRPPTRRELEQWKRLDMAEQEAEERGGWGRLSFREFELSYRLQEMRGNKMDFLGSWIEECIL